MYFLVVKFFIFEYACFRSRIYFHVHQSPFAKGRVTAVKRLPVCSYANYIVAYDET